MATFSKARNNDTLPLIAAVVISSLPRLFFSCFCSYLRMKQAVNKNSTVFKKELLLRGINQRHAASLTALYVQPSKLSSYLFFTSGGDIKKLRKNS